MTELIKCECGSLNPPNIYKAFIIDLWSVGCNKCGKSVLGKSEAEAIEAWNRRADK